MRVVYLVQTHKNPEQIYRLVRLIKKSSPQSFVLISHDFSNCHLDPTPLKPLSGVKILRLPGKGGRGDFSMLQGYLDAVEWLFNHAIAFDWLINLTGQDYPTQPLPQIEAFLAKTRYDGFSYYYKAFSPEEAEWGLQESRDRYLYHHWRSGIQPALWQRALLKPLKAAINNLQPWMRMSWSYDCLMIGRRAAETPFNENFECYGGSYFHTLSRQCVEYLYEFSQRRSDIIEFYQKTCVPVESYIQTVLINGGFNLERHHKRYIDFSNSKHGHPRVLTIQDYPLLADEEIHFARKFEPDQDSEILDRLDARVLEWDTAKIVTSRR